jgi:hypothetical protein
MRQVLCRIQELVMRKVPTPMQQLSRVVRFGRGQQVCMLVEVETRHQTILLNRDHLHQIQAKNAYQEGLFFTVARVCCL